MKNILVATDFSVESHHGFEVALQLAQRTGGAVTLLHVVDLPGQNSANFSAYGGPVRSSEMPNSDGTSDSLYAVQLLAATKQRMHKLIAEATQRAPGVPVHDAADAAELDDTIVRLVQERNIDLVVMSPQQHDTMEQFFTSSNTERMIRLAPCPVLAVKHEEPHFEVRNIVFPSDFTAEVEQAAPQLQRILNLFPDAKLHLLHVSAEDNESTRAQMQRFAERHQLLGRAQPAVFSASSTSQGIGVFAEQMKADLIVLPTHARSGLSRLFQSSIAEKVATHAFTPVLTFHL